MTMGASPPAKWLGRLRQWLAGRSLRGRLITGLLALLALACAVVGVVTYLALQGFLFSQLDASLTGAVHRYHFCLISPSGETDREREASHAPPVLNVPQNCAAQQASGTLTTRILHGSVISAYVAGPEGAVTAVLSPADKRALKSLPAGSRGDVALSRLGSYRMMRADGDRPGLTYAIGLPLHQPETTLREVEIVEIIVVAAALVLTGVIGTGWVRLSLRPLRRVAATATRVTMLPLGTGEVSLPERVPGADPRTEVGQVGSALNRMLGHVEAALARRAASEARLRRFAADASHELRTPLAAIRGYAELARRHPGPVPADIAHALARVEAESARMGVLVDELLLLAQLDAGRPLARDPVDLTRLAIDATSDARATAPDHRWQLQLPGEPVVVTGDEHRLRQVMANLLSNAAKHTPPATMVTVALAEPDPLTGAVTLTVTDNGPGIPPDLLPGLFERFVRGDSSRSRAAGSTGLGLAIVDAVTTAHGGSVGVTSEPGRTQFVITLPGAQYDPSGGRENPAEGPDQSVDAGNPESVDSWVPHT